MAFQSFQEILKLCEKESWEFWEAVARDDQNERGVPPEEAFEKMRRMWRVMVESSENYDSERRSNSGLVGGDGGRMFRYAQDREPLSGYFMGEVIAQALCMGESNACMRRIVAAPTAGACGVLPAVLIPLWKKEELPEEEIVRALYTAAGVGQVIAARAYIAGASGGCQAEIGTASAMAAGALVQLRGGDGVQITHAAAMALKNLLGLVCDPVAGLVEVPCVKRNVAGAVNALAAADMSLAGIVSQIPPDQVVDAMKEVGDAMDSSLKETGKGGLAATPRGKSVKISCRI
ncbi:putative uncharacterized protein [Blautia hydrogenotrophica CAG:147]|uniref:L-serine ammonia-lyase, iron-sulfur-dependent, subunit alpha n=1 Tax=Blautia hydrogenotrophica TaxID=53443 RepID=UPI00033B4A14|nr:L-serine ammonia-lyase, iron-sulfur-dependent, subunit alpha [Blautia hydrogenotrophica]CCX58670.1 putative uncharacterized protein [Blautia hydrogenotrophica CAG:147]